MNTFAAVMTGKGTGAISTIQVFGDSAEAVVKKIFTPTAAMQAEFKTGKILLGKILDGDQTIDQVTLGCEGQNNFAIHCHGNPLIVADIMKMLQRCGVTLLTAEQLLTKILSSQKAVNTIAIEANLARLKAKTIEGTKIIANQIEAGLSATATEWLENINETPLNQISTDAKRILESSRIAKLIIEGCTAALIGPPNSGKSTLLNCLAGRQKAIVTDIKGTTRDWVEAVCRIESLSLRLIDTAGLDEELNASEDIIGQSAQKKSIEILQQADLILLVMDNSKTNDRLDKEFLKKISGKLVLTVLNKCDLPAGFDTNKLPDFMLNSIRISAKEGTGIENMLENIRQICGISNFDLKTTVCFTQRQNNLLKQLKNAKSTQQAASVITELLNAALSV
ncbi:MAG: GTP-binding protein [Planctomycetes bacterium]|nr:GTP-binding protein [Planctomycetota bacterium]